MPGKIVEFTTPKKFVLRGFWIGPEKPERLIIFIHGLSSSAFSGTGMGFARQLADKKHAVLVFNNRGHDIVAKLYRDKKKPLLAGAAHEIFTDCADDIQGAVDFAKKSGAKNVYLAGHSTGCQKSIYWASKAKNDKTVKGIILLAPISDYSSDVKACGKANVERLADKARALVRAGKPHALIPSEELQFDAQRYLSLFTLDSAENIFSYANLEKNPKTLKSIRKPVLVLLGEKDEYGDMPAKQIALWLQENLSGKYEIHVIPNVPHSFDGAHKRCAALMKSFIHRS